MNSRRRLLLILAYALTLVSCDKAKNFAEKASSAVKDRIASKTGAGDASKTDPALQKLVDQTPDGVSFRKDLPFPTHLEVRITRHQEWSGRFSQSSAIERHAEALKGTRTSVSKLERAGDQVRHTSEKTNFSIPSADDPDGAKQILSDPLSANAPSAQSHTFRKTGKSWLADPAGGFRNTTLAKELSPFFDGLLIENALAPRPLWFAAKKRFKPGDQLVVTGDSLPMLLAGKATGTLTLKLESFESVEGHPCGVFTVSGDYSRRQFPDFEGIFTDEDVTIQSGKLWLSLIHPIILREQLDTIQTLKSGNRGNQSSRGQGSIKVSVKRAWKPLGA
ncbi:MAG: hypothetical protein Q8Q59_04620 [Luteolibacter sp.]|jgi:hypothetical protein|nr:hypothetical protein [Luteolibacter sp.]